MALVLVLGSLSLGLARLYLDVGFRGPRAHFEKGIRLVMTASRQGCDLRAALVVCEID